MSSILDNPNTIVRLHIRVSVSLFPFYLNYIYISVFPNTSLLAAGFKYHYSLTPQQIASMADNIVGDYILASKVIGSGSYGHVVKAHHKDTNNVFAVKIIKINHSDANQNKYIEREVNIMKGLLPHKT